MDEPARQHSPLGRWIGRAATERGDATYLADARSRRTLTYRELAAAVDRWDGLAHRWPGTGWVAPDAVARLLIWTFLTSRPA